jgi:hypothetical protein
MFIVWISKHSLGNHEDFNLGQYKHEEWNRTNKFESMRTFQVEIIKESLWLLLWNLKIEFLIPWIRIGFFKAMGLTVFLQNQNKRQMKIFKMWRVFVGIFLLDSMLSMEVGYFIAINSLTSSRNEFPIVTSWKCFNKIQYICFMFLWNENRHFLILWQRKMFVKHIIPLTLIQHVGDFFILMANSTNLDIFE